jgi:hypothetical protein
MVGNTVVRVVYSDESGVGSIKEEPLTVVTAIVLNADNQWEPVEAALRLAEVGMPPKLLHKRQMKGSVLYSAVRKGVPAASNVLKGILSIPAREGIGIFYGAVDRAGIRSLHSASKSGSPLAEYQAAFADCLDRVDTAAKIFAAGERVLWIADRSDKEREPATRSSHSFHKLFTEVRPRAKPKAAAVVTERGLAGLMDALSVETTGQKSSIVDTVYFGNAEHSIALQLADVCCSTVTRHLLEKFYQRSPIVEPFYELIRPQIMTSDVVPLFRGR